MSPLRKTQESTAVSRSVKPKLTIDTRVHPKPTFEPPCTQSAPVGTRQEKGIPPMYQAVDRHCTKVAEMMNSPTWRSQRSWTHVVDDGAPFELLDAHHAYNQRPLAPCSEGDGRWDSHSEQEDTNDVPNSPTRQCTQRRHADSGISLGRDAEAMNINGIHPLSEVPDILNKAFIISASVSSRPCHSPGDIYGELLPVIVPKRRSEFQNKIDQDKLSSELLSSESNFEYGPLENYEENSCHGSPPFPCHLSGQYHSEDGRDGQGVLDRTKYRARDIHLLMERDAAIKSVNSQQAPQPPHRRPDPEDTQRFQGLLGRLCRGAETLKAGETGKNTLNDPAIISFAPKENIQQSSHRELEIPLKLYRSPPKGITKGNRHDPSDSGYASSSTRTQSRSRHDTSDEIGFQPIAIQSGKAGSKESVPDHSPKSSTLNPAAKEFSSTSSHSAPFVKRNLLGSPASNHTFLSPPLGQAPFGMGIHSQSFGFNVLPSLDSPFASLALPPPASLQMSPAFLPQSVPFPLPALPPQPGLGLSPSLAAGIHGLGSISGLPLRPSPSSLGLTRQLQPPVSGPMPGPIPGEFVGAFHQQLPTIPSCNNPAHQTDVALSTAQGFPAPTIPQLAPPAPPASLFAPTNNAPMPPSIAPAAPVVNPIFRKNVPKPKVPNTTGQQYWEYWHELRRTFEPGYAQKSKQNQQKRYMKQQVHQNGGTTDDA